MSTWQDLKNSPRLKNIYQKRARIIKAAREFFWSKDFMETDTPIVVRYAGQEPYLNPVPVVLHHPMGHEYKMYLHTSPEFALKKLLAAGFDKIFSIAKCFRDFEDFGGTHNTEFTMLEWYRKTPKLEQIMDDAEELFKYTAEKIGVQKINYNNKKADIFCVWERKSMREIWQQYAGVNLDDYLEIEKIKELAVSKKYAVDDADEYEDIFYKIFLNEVESYLGQGRPIFIYDYPARMCPLSRLCKNDNRYAERFELYICGLELANAFGELSDADEQKNNLEKDMALRAKLKKEIWPIDPDFISALRAGIGEAGGIALGIDRMVLLFTGAHDLNEVIFGSVNDQIANP